MRAYAILMMVQGHLIETLIAPEFRDDSNYLYLIWNFMRGITAPVFFFASGSIFAFLLMKQEDKGIGFKNPRARKGFKRTIFLLALGYALQITPGFYIFITTGNTNRLNWFIVSHVLQVIAIALLMIVITYLIFRNVKPFLYIPYIIAGNLIFLFFPDFLEINFNAFLPKIIANYFTTANGSAFTVVPWAGFSMLGAAYGVFLFQNKDLVNNRKFFYLIILSGILLHIYSGNLLNSFYYILGWDNLKLLFENNFLYFRMGQVLIIAGLFGLLAIRIRIPKIITIIGSETLAIYFWHSVLIYGSITTYGLSQHFKHTLNPWQCVGLALMAEALLIVIAFYTYKIKRWLKKRRKTKALITTKQSI